MHDVHLYRLIGFFGLFIGALIYKIETIAVYRVVATCLTVSVGVAFILMLRRLEELINHIIASLRGTEAELFGHLESPEDDETYRALPAAYGNSNLTTGIIAQILVGLLTVLAVTLICLLHRSAADETLASELNTPAMELHVEELPQEQDPSKPAPSKEREELEQQDASNKPKQPSESEKQELPVTDEVAEEAAPKPDLPEPQKEF